MGRLNTVMLYGMVAHKVKNKPSPVTGEIISSKVALCISRRQYAREDMELGGAHILSYPILIGRDERVVPVMSVLQPGDMILVKGNMATREIPKPYLCRKCNHITIRSYGVVIYVDPVFVEKVGHFDDPKEGTDYVGNNLTEVSNQIIIDGKVCTDIEYYESGDRRHRARVSNFKIASNRLRKRAYDEPDRDTDYPCVRSFGKIALENKYALHVGSEITINGAIQTREFPDKEFCENCGNLIERQGLATEIVPYSIEYREFCDKPESTHAEEEYIAEVE